MDKKRTSIWIDPYVLRELKVMGARRGQPVGNVIEALVKFADMDRFVTDEEFRSRFNALLKTAFANAECADPEQDTAHISVRDAIKLDHAYVAETGEAPPILTAYAERLAELSTDAPAHAVKTPVSRVLEIVGEVGELSADVEKVFGDGRMTPVEHAKLDKDIKDAMRALGKLERDLRAMRSKA